MHIVLGTSFQHKDRIVLHKLLDTNDRFAASTGYLLLLKLSGLKLSAEIQVCSRQLPTSEDPGTEGRVRFPLPQQMQQVHAYPAKFPVKLLHNNRLSSRAWPVGFGAEPNLVRDALSIVVDFFSFSSSPIQGAELGYLDQGKFMAVPPGEEWRDFLQEWQQASVQEGCLVLCMNGPANREIFSKFVADRFVPLVATAVGTLEEPDDLPTAQFSGVLSGPQLYADIKQLLEGKLDEFKGLFDHQRATSISISEVGSGVAHQILCKLAITVEDGHKTEALEGGIMELPKFNMAKYANENEATPLALVHIQECLTKHSVKFGRGGFEVHDVHTQKLFWQLPFEGKVFKGGIDGVIAPFDVARCSAARQLRCAIELKHSEMQKALYRHKKFGDEVPPTAAPTSFSGTVEGQVFIETLAACVSAEYPDVMLLLTDIDFNTLVRYKSGVITKWEDISFEAAIGKLAEFLNSCSTKRSYSLDVALKDMSETDTASFAVTQELRKKLRPHSVLSEQLASILHPDMSTDERFVTALELIQAHRPSDPPTDHWQFMFG